MRRPVQRQDPRTATRPQEPLRAETPPYLGSRTPAAVVLALQAQVGNAAVSRLLARAPGPDVKTPDAGPAKVDDPAPAPAPSPAGGAPEPPITATGIPGAQQWYDRARAHYVAGRYQQSATAFAEAYKLHPQPEILYNQAAALEKAGQPDQAIALYTRYVTERPDAPDAAKVTAHIAKLRGKAAASPPAKVDDPAPAPAPAPAGGAPEPPDRPITAPGTIGMQQYNERASAHYKAGRYEKARRDWAEAYNLRPISTFLRDQADALEHLGRNTEAADLYERYLAEGPLLADKLKIRSRIKKLRGEQIPEGQDDDEPPITAKGKAGAQAWFDRGQLAFLGGRFAKAADCFRSAFALHPLPAFIYNEASSLEEGRHPAAAANAYEHYLFLDPSAKDATEVVAKIKTLRSQAPASGKDTLIDPEDEASEAPAVTAKGKRGASEWHNRGQVAWALGDYKRAYNSFVEAYAAHAAPEFVYNQAASLDKLGDADGAVKAYERYLALAPKAKDAAKVRTRIQRLQERPAGGAPLKTP